MVMCGPAFTGKAINGRPFVGCDALPQTDGVKMMNENFHLRFPKFHTFIMWVIIYDKDVYGGLKGWWRYVTRKDGPASDKQQENDT